MNASDVMSRNIISVGRGTTVAAAIRLMLDNHISGLPVLDAGRPVGILTEGDLLRRSETGTERHRPRWLEILMGPGRLADEYVRTHGRKVEEIMTRQPVSVTPDTPLDEIVALMERRRIKQVPVLDGDVPVGIVSRADLLRALRRGPRVKPAAASDQAIRTGWWRSCKPAMGSRFACQRYRRTAWSSSGARSPMSASARR
jgi:CBS domain-containing protein